MSNSIFKRCGCRAVVTTPDGTVTEWLTSWLAAKKGVVRATTHLSYTQQVHQYLMPLVGHYRLDKLRVVHVRLAMEQIAELSAQIADQNAARHAVLAATKAAWR